MSSLKDRAVTGVVWSFLQKVGSRGIIFIIMILLARFLTPSDFGLVGMLVIFIQLSQAIVEGGFNLALIQKKNPDDVDYSSVFYINLLVSSILYLVLFLLAPFIAKFYHQPELVSLARVMGIVFLVNAFSFIQETRLIKSLDFRTLTWIHIPSTIIGGTISITMAFWGYGVWSIVALQLIIRTVFTAQIWVYTKWRPLYSFSKRRIKDLFSFGSKLLVSRIIGVAYNNTFLIVIAKFYPLQNVGYYQNSYNLVNTPSETLSSVLNSVTFPVFSSMQEDNRLLKVNYRRVIEQVFFWICPIFTFSGILAFPLFDFLFGGHWKPAAPYFQWLCVVGIFSPINMYSLNIVNVKGRSDVFLKLQTIKRILTIIAVVAVIPYGAKAFLMIQAGSEVFAFFIFSRIAGRFINYSLFEQLGDLFPIVLLTIMVGVTVFFIALFLKDTHNIWQLSTGLLGMIMYWVFAYIFKFRACRDFFNIVEDYILKRSNKR